MAWPLPPRLAAQQVEGTGGGRLVLLLLGARISSLGQQSPADSCGPTVRSHSSPTRPRPRMFLLCFLSAYYVPATTDVGKAIHSFTHSFLPPSL